MNKYKYIQLGTCFENKRYEAVWYKASLNYDLKSTKGECDTVSDLYKSLK